MTKSLMHFAAALRTLGDESTKPTDAFVEAPMTELEFQDARISVRMEVDKFSPAALRALVQNYEARYNKLVRK